jgi:hypothetical protein
MHIQVSPSYELLDSARELRAQTISLDVATVLGYKPTLTQYQVFPTSTYEFVHFCSCTQMIAIFATQRLRSKNSCQM